MTMAILPEAVAFHALPLVLHDRGRAFLPSPPHPAARGSTMDLKIEVNDAGSPYGIRILDAPTGEDVTSRLQAQRIALISKAGQAPRIEGGC